MQYNEEDDSSLSGMHLAVASFPQCSATGSYTRVAVVHRRVTCKSVNCQELHAKMAISGHSVSMKERDRSDLCCTLLYRGSHRPCQN